MTTAVTVTNEGPCHVRVRTFYRSPQPPDKERPNDTLQSVADVAPGVLQRFLYVHATQYLVIDEVEP